MIRGCTPHPLGIGRGIVRIVVIRPAGWESTLTRIREFPDIHRPLDAQTSVPRRWPTVRTIRASLVALPFVGLAVLIAALSILLGAPQ
jgi:hypothetical protein